MKHAINRGLLVAALTLAVTAPAAAQMGGGMMDHRGMGREAVDRCKPPAVADRRWHLGGGS